MKITFDRHSNIKNNIYIMEDVDPASTNNTLSYKYNVKLYSEYIKLLKPYETNCYLRGYISSGKNNVTFRVLTVSPYCDDFKWPEKPVKVVEHKNDTITFEFNKMITDVGVSFLI